MLLHSFRRGLFLATLVLSTSLSSLAVAQDVLSATPEGPATLDVVLGQLRTLREQGDAAPKTIRLQSGTYRLAETIRLDAALVGEGLTIEGAADQPTVLSGAMELQADDGTEQGRWRYDVPAAFATEIPRVLVVDGRLRSPARHPNVGYARIVAAAENRRSGFRFDPADIPDDVSPYTGVCDLILLHDWSSSRLPVRTLNHQNFVLETVGPIGCSAPHYAIDHFEKQPRYWLEGHPALADVPGEWTFDREANEVVLLAASDEPAPRVELPVLDHLLLAGDDEGGQIQNLNLRNLTFTGSRFPMPAGGLAGAQATMHEPRSEQGERTTGNRPMLSAAVHLTQAHGCEVTDCTFRALGNTALWIGSRSVDCSIRQCRFEDIGGNGINLGENNSRQVAGRPWYQSAPEQVPRNNRVEDCDVRRVGRVLMGAVGIWAALHENLEIANNRIEDCPYTGISLGWLWNDGPSPAKNNNVHHNQIRRVMQVLSDGGGIYTLGRQPASRLHHNTITDVPLNAGRAESNGMFLDEGTTGFTISENRFRRISKSPLRFHRAGENLAEQNQWELETADTPPVRYNSTPEENITLRDNTVLPRQPRVYLIGNSLTWDTVPSKLQHFVNWHVDCGKSLQHIREDPAQPCVTSSHLWPTALDQLQYDYLVVQPHYGTTLDQDLRTIEHWLQMQPAATLVLHTGWAFHDKADQEYASQDAETMTHNEAYFAALLETLRQRHPQRTIRSTRAAEAIHRISAEIQRDEAPFDSLAQLYRDAIHMTVGEGRYLMHNLMRHALDQPLTDTGFTFSPQQRDRKAYLDGVLAHFTSAEPRPTTSSEQ
ncbi:right-handed parallel beta-helix repeat-containing protein [Roseimaritima sediminicola]|uniref:right-handed parallel beta-helix repeat-containing protein n=1 Tax=Roseimaritima sediminicola TaxID=2662066 RepID=UPI0012984F25|nr:right-handed parallel beta-helix repeat-containing protein [Roseimaritima sediminicola]